MIEKTNKGMRTEELDEILAAREAARVLQEQEGNPTPTPTEEPEKVETPIQEEPKVEEPKVETGEGEEEEEKDTFIEALKEIKPETSITEVPKVELPEDFKKELDEYKSKLSLYESDPLVQAVIMGATDKDIKQIAKEIAASDVSELSTTQLIEKAIKDDFPNYSAEELAEALDAELSNYESLTSPLSKKRYEDDLRTKYSNSGYSSQTLAKIQEAFKAKEATKVPEIDQAELNKNIVEQETTLLKTIGKGLLGTVHKGVTFDEAKLNEILGEYDMNKVTPYLNSEGKLDAVGFIQDKFERKYQNDMMEYEIEKRVKQRMKEFVVTGKATPSTTPSVSKLSEVEQRLKDRGFNEAQIKAMTRQSRTID